MFTHSLLINAVNRSRTLSWRFDTKPLSLHERACVTLGIPTGAKAGQTIERNVVSIRRNESLNSCLFKGILASLNK